MTSDFGANPPDIEGLTFVSWLGCGHTSDVFLYARRAMNGRVVVKVSHRPTAAATVTQLKTDMGILEGLHHPDVLPVLAVDSTADGRIYLTTPYAAHSSLADHCGRT